VPGLPEFDLRELGQLGTLGAIAERLGGVAPPQATPAAPVPPLLRLVTHVRPCAPAEPAVLPGLTAVVGGGLLGVALAAALDKRGATARPFGTVPEEATSVVYLGLPGTGATPIETAALAVAAARAFAPRSAAPGALFVTVQDSGGDFGLSGQADDVAWPTGLHALARTAALEWPSARVKAIDIPVSGREPEVFAATLADEVLRHGVDAEVGLPRLGGRVTLRTEEQPPPITRVRTGFVPDGAVLLVTGGARGITAACIQALAAAVPVKLALLGRSALAAEPAELADLQGATLRTALAHSTAHASPALIAREAGAIEACRDVRRTLDLLARSGCEATYHSVDVSDAAAVAATVDAVRRRWGRIDGIVHGAGQIADRMLAEKTTAQVRQVFAPKVEGLRVLLQATTGDALRMIALFASVAGRFGNAGQADYAMANAILAGVARTEARRRGASCLVRAFAWGPWDGGMVSPQLRRAFAQRGIATIGLEQGARAFVQEMLHGVPGVAEAEIVLTAPAGAGLAMAGRS
jgi:NAD(P)-dependent dehydrogenase (short-subunit alcohol dehydrogenase family)